MRPLAAVLFACGAAAPAVASDKHEKEWPAERKGKEPLASRTTPPIITPVHSMARAGNPQHVAKWAIPGVTPHECGGYVGGGSLLKGRAPYAPGPIDGTFGWDYVGFGRRPGRIFLGFFGPNKYADPFYPKYEANGPRLPDPIADAPFRKAVIEAKDEHGPLHGGGGHGKE